MTGQPQDAAPLYDLADARIVYRLCFEFFERHVELAARLSKQEIQTEEAQRTEVDLVQWMAWTLGGENPQFKPVSGWSGAPLGRRLRQHFASDLIAMDEERRSRFEADESVIVYAMCRFMEEVQSLICELQSHEEDATQSDARSYHDLCVRWTELLTDRAFEDGV